MTTPHQQTRATSISEGEISNKSQISGGSAWMNESLIEGLMEVYKTLTFTSQEIQWVYARGYTNINAIVRDACLTTENIDKMLMKETINNKEYHDMIIKIIIIGRYFFSQVFPDYKYHELDIDAEDFPTEDHEMEQFIDRFFNVNKLQAFARNHYGQIYDELMEAVHKIKAFDKQQIPLIHNEE